MNTREIKRLRRKFIAVAMASIFLAMMFIGTTVNVLSYMISRLSVNRTLDVLIESAEVEVSEREARVSFSDIFMPEYAHNTFFVLRFDENGKLAKVRSNTQDEAQLARVEAYTGTITDKTFSSGHYRGYYYKRVASSDGQVTIAFLEGNQILSTALRTFILTLLLCFLGLIVTFFLVRRLSARAIRPEVENSQRQKAFITNASHELKTPLAVIRANTEMIELTSGESEWTAATLKQVDHLNGLIQNLVMITRAQEQEDRGELTQIDATGAVSESVDPYDPLASQKGLTLRREISDNVRIVADGSKIRQLTTILIDNAIKYCDENGTILVTLSPFKNGKGLRLDVANDYKDGADVDCDRFFDRFYREDASHNIDKGGYGIGLSIAESICRQYKGSISAHWKDGVIHFTCTMK